MSIVPESIPMCDLLFIGTPSGQICFIDMLLTTCDRISDLWSYSNDRLPLSFVGFILVGSQSTGTGKYFNEGESMGCDVQEIEHS